MMLIHPAEVAAAAAGELWHDVWETAWRRVEVLGAECDYISLDGRAWLSVEFTSEIAAANDLRECAHRVVYTAPDGRTYVWKRQP